MGRGLDAARECFVQAGKEKHFQLLKPWLSGDVEGLSQSWGRARGW